MGQTFQHRNRLDKLRDISPASSLCSRSDSVASQKRKVGIGDDLLLRDLNAAKVCRVDDNEDEEIAKLDSKMSKVSTMCGKMLTSVQQLEIQDPLRVIIADLIETVRITNEVQGELHTKLKAKRASTQGNEYVSSIWEVSDFPAHPPSLEARRVETVGRNCQVGSSPCWLMTGAGLTTGMQSNR